MTQQSQPQTQTATVWKLDPNHSARKYSEILHSPISRHFLFIS